MGKENVQAAGERARAWRGQGKDAKTTIGCFLECMGRVVVGSIDGNIVASVLETEGSIHDEALCTTWQNMRAVHRKGLSLTDTKVRMDERDVQRHVCT